MACSVAEVAFDLNRPSQKHRRAKGCTRILEKVLEESVTTFPASDEKT